MGFAAFGFAAVWGSARRARRRRAVEAARACEGSDDSFQAGEARSWVLRFPCRARRGHSRWGLAQNGQESGAIHVGGAKGAEERGHGGSRAGGRRPRRALRRACCIDAKEVRPGASPSLPWTCEHVKRGVRGRPRRAAGAHALAKAKYDHSLPAARARAQRRAHGGVCTAAPVCSPAAGAGGSTAAAGGGGTAAGQRGPGFIGKGAGSHADGKRIGRNSGGLEPAGMQGTAGELLIKKRMGEKARRGDRRE